ncbi:hypothetical protein ACQ4PT_071139 [Festuca glaucescens]
MSRDSDEKNVFGVDPMEHYKHIISKLLLKKEDTSSTGVMKRAKGVVAQNNVKASQESSPLFSEEIRGLSKCDMERLKHVLRDIFTILNDDVDEIFGYILAISEFRSVKLLSSHARGSCEEEIAPPSAKKRKTLTVSEPDACEELRSHISSDIFEQLTRDIRLIEESGETRQVALQKFSDGLLRKLSKMAQGVDDLLDTLASKCRSMTTAEKIELGKRIHKLPEKALDHMVEVVKMRKPEISGSDKVSFNLGRLDDATLWRLYYYVETALKAKQDLTITPPQVFNGQ